MVLAQAELLSFLPAEHPRRREVLGRFQQHMEGLKRCQHPNGGWHQVLNEPRSWIETSCTCMFVYGFALGVREGWLDSSCNDTVKKGWNAITEKVTDSGEIIDTCGSTDTGNLQYYMNRPRIKNDLHGYGSFMLAAAETARLEKSLAR
jgi:unsaturated rhamnogalacturonyl hydrolase